MLNCLRFQIPCTIRICSEGKKQRRRATGNFMIPLRILTLIVAGPAQPGILVLEPVEKSTPGKSRVVPIWIGPNEAAQLSVALNQVKLPRPTTHDLFLDTLTNLDARVDHVLINRAEDKTFYSRLFVKQGERIIELDARPTDSISLALRQQAPLFITEEVLDKASYPYLSKFKPTQEEELDVFRTFLESISPEDFSSAQ